MTELKDCPFCGGKGILKTIFDKRYFNEFVRECMITCESCNVHFKRLNVHFTINDNFEVIVQDEELEKAIARWNKRVYQVQTPDTEFENGQVVLKDGRHLYTADGKKYIVKTESIEASKADGMMILLDGRILYTKDNMVFTTRR